MLLNAKINDKCKNFTWKMYYILLHLKSKEQFHHVQQDWLSSPIVFKFKLVSVPDYFIYQVGLLAVVQYNCRATGSSSLVYRTNGPYTWSICTTSVFLTATCLLTINKHQNARSIILQMQLVLQDKITDQTIIFPLCQAWHSTSLISWVFQKNYMQQNILYLL